MPTNYTLRCDNWNSQHVKFSVFDRQGANCGSVTVLAQDALFFIQRVWHGDLDWNGKLPDDAVDNPHHYGAFEAREPIAED